MTADLPALRQLCRENADVAAVFTRLPQCRLRQQSLRLRYLLSQMGSTGGEAMDFGRLAAALRLVGGLGFGVLSDPQRLHRARFTWSVDPFTLCQAMRDDRLQLRAEDHVVPPAAPVPPPQVVDTLTVPRGWRFHRFPLRPEADVALLLPPDLTDREAARLGHLLLAHAAG